METKIRITKKEALAEYLSLNVKQIDKDTFECNEGEYLVLSDYEANKLAKEYIKESLWAFNKSFLDNYGVVSEITDKQWANLVDSCEDSNNIVTHLVGKNNLAGLIRDAIYTDGRGHFLSPYDGEENCYIDYYIYRIN